MFTREKPKLDTVLAELLYIKDINTTTDLEFVTVSGINKKVTICKLLVRHLRSK